jgi:hypothetical protein
MTADEGESLPDSTDPAGYEEVRVLVETAERTFRGTLYKPMTGRYRFSDHLNNYDRQFLCLTNVQITDRGSRDSVGEQHDFIAVSVSAITYVTPIDGAD